MAALAHARHGDAASDSEKTIHRTLKAFPEIVGQNLQSVGFVAQHLPGFIKILCHDYPAFSVSMRRTASRSSGVSTPGPVASTSSTRMAMPA